ncbi:MAG: hypothetical protein IJ008_05215 [Clostridia bacterium]|nr:hypothetical protein [Clostridia bacterium]
MDRIKLKGYIGIANKAGFLVIGGDNLEGYNKKLFLLLIDKNSGKNLKKITYNLKEEKNINIYELDNLNEIVGIENCKAIGIRNKGLSDKIKILIEEGE